MEMTTTFLFAAWSDEVASRSVKMAEMRRACLNILLLSH